MATPTIQIQPRGIVSSLDAIYYQFSEYTADTLNIVVQLQYDTTGAGNWVNWGGRMRCAPKLNQAGIYQLFVQDVLNSLPKSDVDDLPQLGSGCCYSGAIGLLPQKFWAGISNWKCRVVAQREYIDAATGFVELDPDEVTSVQIIIHEGSQPRRNKLWQSIVTDSHQFAEFLMQQSTTDNRTSWLWLTDCIWQRNRKTNAATYYVNIRDTEQFYINTFVGRLLGGITQTTDLVIYTYDHNGMSLASRSINWNAGMTNDGMQTIDVGFRSYACSFRNDPQGGELSDFSNVGSYKVMNLVSDSTNTTHVRSSVWNFKVIRTCKPDSYQRFLWKNQLGGWDMFSSEGKFTSRRKIKHETYEKRYARGERALYNFGKNNWVNTEDEVMQIETQPITQAEAMWFSKIGSSAFTYLRIDMESKYNPQAYGTFDEYETWRDAGKCNDYIPIVINSSSIKITDTNKRHQKVSFEYQLATRNLYPRN